MKTRVVKAFDVKNAVYVFHVEEWLDQHQGIDRNNLLTQSEKELYKHHFPSKEPHTWMWRVTHGIEETAVYVASQLAKFAQTSPPPHVVAQFDDDGNSVPIWDTV